MELKSFIEPVIQPLLTDATIRSFDVLVCLLTFGGVIVAISVIDDKWRLRGASAALGAFGGLTFSAGQPVEISLALFTFVEAVWIGLALVFGGMMGDLLAWKTNAGPFAIFGDMGDGAKLALAPRRWPEAKGKPAPSGQDLAKRFFVAISAATGGVVGSLLTLEQFWTVFFTSLTIAHLFRAMLFTIVSVTLVGPLHEYILHRGLELDAHGHAANQKDPASFFSEITPFVAMRFGLVLVFWILLEVTLGALSECVSSKNVLAMYQIVLAGLTPGFVSYYWCAALQLDAPSVQKTATWPSVASGAAMFCGLGAGVAIVFMSFLGWTLDITAGETNAFGLFIGVVAVFSITTLAASLSFSWFICGVYAMAGGYAIDRYRGPNHMVALGAALMLATVPQQALVIAAEMMPVLVVATGNVEDTSSGPQASEATAPEKAASGQGAPSKPTGIFEFLGFFSLFAGTVGWYFGLVASGFPALIKREEPPNLAQGLI
jgi:hypothetical protein